MGTWKQAEYIYKPEVLKQVFSVLLSPQPRSSPSSTSGTLPFATVLSDQQSKEPPDIKEVRTA